MVRDQFTGCRGCASGEGGYHNIFGNKFGQRLAAIQVKRELLQAQREVEEEAKAKVWDLKRDNEAGDEESDDGEEEGEEGPELASGAAGGGAGEEGAGGDGGSDAEEPSTKRRRGAE